MKLTTTTIKVSHQLKTADHLIILQLPSQSHGIHLDHALLGRFPCKPAIYFDRHTLIPKGLLCEESERQVTYTQYYLASIHQSRHHYLVS